jgi:hypothetical protein
VDVSFSKSSYLLYRGTITADGLDTLKSLVLPGNRSHWDSMAFENRGGTTSLAIRSMEIEIEYDETCCGRAKTSLIAYVTNRTLSAGESSLYISGYRGRREYVKDYFGWSNT